MHNPNYRISIRRTTFQRSSCIYSPDHLDLLILKSLIPYIHGKSQCVAKSQEKTSCISKNTWCVLLCNFSIGIRARQSIIKNCIRISKVPIKYKVPTTVKTLTIAVHGVRNVSGLNSKSYNQVPYHIVLNPHRKFPFLTERDNL